MSAPEFVHLHVHSEYSLLDGANRIWRPGRGLSSPTVNRALALTDHGNMFGAIELYQEGQRGRSEAGDRLRGIRRASQSRLIPHSKKKGNGYNHLTLLARDEAGYHNLIEAGVEGLTSRATTSAPGSTRNCSFQHAEGNQLPLGLPDRGAQPAVPRRSRGGGGREAGR